MFIYAGIDEAGYGPMLGPLVIARTVISLEDRKFCQRPPSLWSLMQSGICRGIRDKRNRIAVNDSKILYSRALGLKHLERGVLSFLDCCGIRPQHLTHLAEKLALDAPSHTPGLNLPWYADSAGAPLLPFDLEPRSLSRSRARLARLAAKTGVQLEDVRTAVIFEDRFNHLVKTTGNKASCAWTFVSAHLRSIWDAWGMHHPLVAVDRQGGRKHYEEQLKTLFPEAHVEVARASYSSSEYEISGAGRSMRVQIEIGGDSIHFPVALASMTAKYLRELYMMRFQRFWSEHAPDVKPTFGYFGDGRRFLGEISPVLEVLGIDENDLVRCS